MACLGIAAICSPIWTLTFSYPIHLKACLAPEQSQIYRQAGYAWLYAYLIAGSNAMMIDVITYLAVFGYMRRHRVSVAVLPTTQEELRPSKTVNLVTSPSSLLLLLVSAAVTIPPTALLVR